MSSIEDISFHITQCFKTLEKAWPEHHGENKTGSPVLLRLSSRYHWKKKVKVDGNVTTVDCFLYYPEQQTRGTNVSIAKHKKAPFVIQSFLLFKY